MLQVHPGEEPTSMRARDHFRAHARRAVRLEAVVSDEHDTWSLDARVVDLGLGGACVELGATDRLHADAAVTLVVHAPSLWDPLVLRGRVAWTRGLREGGVRLGLRFEHLEQGGLFALFQLLGAQSYE